MNGTGNMIVCGVCGNKRRITDIVYVDADSGVAVCSGCAARISVDLVEWEKKGLEKIEELFKTGRKGTR